MKRSNMLLAGAAVLALAPMSRADFQYQQTSRMTGGMAASLARFGGKSATEPLVSTVALKGNRMVHINKHTAQITDLDKETITHVDFDKKTYNVMTFAEMRQMLENMKSRAAGQGTDAKFNVSVRDTGKTRNISGFNTSDYVLVLEVGATDRKSGEAGALNVTSDMWMAQDIPGYQEVTRFYQRMAQKMGEGWTGGSPFGNMQGGMGKGVAEMSKEVARMKGVPVLQVMRVGATTNGAALPPASEVPELGPAKHGGDGNGAGSKAAEGAAQGAANSASSEAVSQAGRIGGIGGSIASGAMGGLAGSLGGFGRKKKPAQQASSDQPAAQTAGAPGAMLMMQMEVESSGFTTSADASNFEIPGGFKKEPSAFEKMK